MTTAIRPAQESIRGGSKTGRRYSKKGKTWTASAPGEAPANVEGDLADSIAAKAGQGGEAETVVTDWKAHTMEFGTAGGRLDGATVRAFIHEARESARPA